jgi:DNA polymerase-3 subunit epsilon
MWAANLLAKPAGWVILDTETTGFGAADIIEIAVISLEGDVLCNTLVRPQLPISAPVIALTGITEQDVLLAPPFAAVYETLLARMLTSSKLLIYNARFDVPMLQRNIATYCAGRQWEPREQVCLMQAYAEYSGGANWCSLETACAAMGVSQALSHRALQDCQASLALMHAMAR